VKKSLDQQLKNAYLNWLNQKITLRDLNGVIEITSPLVDRHNDYLQIYAIPKENGIILTDDGYIISDLLMSGLDIDSTKKRKEIFQTILNGYGVQRSEKDELFVEATIDDFPRKKHLLLQAMLTVNDMFMIARPNVQSIFLEDVEAFLIEYEIRYTDNISFTGKSGFSHKFEFVIPKSKFRPERIIKTINNPTRESSEQLLWAWSDTKETRKSDSTLYAILNDSDKPINTDVINALNRYDVKTILWSQRVKYIDDLSA
jgi:hypothetical protein